MGDVTCGSVRQVVVATADGVVAALSVDKHLNKRSRIKLDYKQLARTDEEDSQRGGHVNTDHDTERTTRHVWGGGDRACASRPGGG